MDAVMIDAMRERIKERVEVHTMVDGRLSHIRHGFLHRRADGVIGLRVDGEEFMPATLPTNCRVVPATGSLLLTWAYDRRNSMRGGVGL